MRLAVWLMGAAVALGQQTSPTGFGRMLYPGTGGPTGPTCDCWIGRDIVATM